MTKVDPSFWAGRRVLLTGHTGFKGSWASMWLARMGAKVTGIALAPQSNPNLFSLARVEQDIDSHIVDIRDFAAVDSIIQQADPELVLHMAAQPIVRRAIREPVETFSINMLGPVHILAALRGRPALRAALIVTTDKVYDNRDKGEIFAENGPLGGYDPYGASKAAAEIATTAMAETYFAKGARVATARGGNVIGGGDFSEDRIVPDIARAVRRGERLRLRNPASIRPWQYVLDCLAGYLCFLQALALGKTTVPTLNIGPESSEVRVDKIASSILAALGAPLEWDFTPDDAARESRVLRLDSTLARKVLGWRDHLPGESGLEATATWYHAWREGRDMRETSLELIDDFMSIQDGAPVRAEATAAATQ